jgi:hypothetical protein
VPVEAFEPAPVEAEGQGLMLPEGLFGDRGRDVGIAVSIAADPA